jgi:hypothetical protein
MMLLLRFGFVNLTVTPGYSLGAIRICELDIVDYEAVKLASGFDRRRVLSRRDGRSVGASSTVRARLGFSTRPQGKVS